MTDARVVSRSGGWFGLEDRRIGAHRGGGKDSFFTANSDAGRRSTSGLRVARTRNGAGCEKEQTQHRRTGRQGKALKVMVRVHSVITVVASTTRASCRSMRAPVNSAESLSS